MSRQSQKGGDNSTNIQAENMVMQLGIDEKRAREVFQEMNLQLRKEYAPLCQALRVTEHAARYYNDGLSDYY